MSANAVEICQTVVYKHKNAGIYITANFMKEVGWDLYKIKKPYA